MKKQKFATKREMRHYKSILKTMDPNTQNYWILNRLIKYRYLTPMQAFQLACITRLSARIYELRHDYGIPIETERRRVDGDESLWYKYAGTTFAAYYIGRP